MPIDSRCQRCTLYQRAKTPNPNLSPVGAVKPDVYFIGDSPSKAEDTEKKLMSGNSGRFLRKVLKDVSEETLKIRYYVAYGCHHKESDRQGHELEICSKRLHEDLEKHPPKVIVAFGLEVMRALFGMLPKGSSHYLLRGSPIPYRLKSGQEVPVVLTYPPAQAKAEDSITQDVFASDLARAVEAPGTCEAVDSPEIIVCNTRTKLQECFEKLKRLL